MAGQFQFTGAIPVKVLQLPLICAHSITESAPGHEPGICEGSNPSGRATQRREASCSRRPHKAEIVGAEPTAAPICQTSTMEVQLTHIQ